MSHLGPSLAAASASASSSSTSTWRCPRVAPALHHVLALVGMMVVVVVVVLLVLVLSVVPTARPVVPISEERDVVGCGALEAVAHGRGGRAQEVAQGVDLGRERRGEGFPAGGGEAAPVTEEKKTAVQTSGQRARGGPFGSKNGLGLGFHLLTITCDLLRPHRPKRKIPLSSSSFSSLSCFCSLFPSFGVEEKS